MLRKAQGEAQLDQVLTSDQVSDEITGLLFLRLVDDAVFLKRYYIKSRYPDDLPQDVRPEEAAGAMTAASHLRDFVLAQVRMN